MNESSTSRYPSSSTSTSTRGEFQFRLASTLEEIEQCRELRHAIFVQEQKIPGEAENDGNDEQAIHVMCFPNKNETTSSSSLIATGRLLLLPLQQQSDGGPIDVVDPNENPPIIIHAVLGRISVRANYRGKGIGRQIVQELERIARAKGALRASLTPHDYLENFYASLGYSKSTKNDQWIHVNQHCRLILMEKSLV